MEVINKGILPEDNSVTMQAGSCTQEPGDNCWLHLD